MHRCDAVTAVYMSQPALTPADSDHDMMSRAWQPGPPSQISAMASVPSEPTNTSNLDCNRGGLGGRHARYQLTMHNLVGSIAVADSDEGCDSSVGPRRWGISLLWRLELAAGHGARADGPQVCPAPPTPGTVLWVRPGSSSAHSPGWLVMWGGGAGAISDAEACSPGEMVVQRL